MPYIKQNRRQDFDQHIDRMVKQDIAPGELNYIVTRLLDGVMKSNGVNYGVLAALVGELECTKAELQRRILAPYEDLKIKDNGDAYSVNIPAQ